MNYTEFDNTGLGLTAFKKKSASYIAQKLLWFQLDLDQEGFCALS